MEHPHPVLPPADRRGLGPNRIVEPRTIDAHIRRLHVGLRDQRLELVRTTQHEGYRLGPEHEDSLSLERRSVRTSLYEIPIPGRPRPYRFPMPLSSSW